MHGLFPAGNIQDRQPVMMQLHLAFFKCSLLVGPAMHQVTGQLREYLIYD